MVLLLQNVLIQTVHMGASRSHSSLWGRCVHLFYCLWYFLCRVV